MDEGADEGADEAKVKDTAVGSGSHTTFGVNLLPINRHCLMGHTPIYRTISRSMILHRHPWNHQIRHACAEGRAVGIDQFGFELWAERNSEDCLSEDKVINELHVR